jgi:hypothetical protein
MGTGLLLNMQANRLQREAKELENTPVQSVAELRSKLKEEGESDMYVYALYIYTISWASPREYEGFTTCSTQRRTLHILISMSNHFT